MMLAISYTCCSDSVPADSCPGFWLPDFFPSARFTKNDTGGVLMSCACHDVTHVLACSLDLARGVQHISGMQDLQQLLT